MMGGRGQRWRASVCPSTVGRFVGGAVLQTLQKQNPGEHGRRAGMAGNRRGGRRGVQASGQALGRAVRCIYDFDGERAGKMARVLPISFPLRHAGASAVLLLGDIGRDGWTGDGMRAGKSERGEAGRARAAAPWPVVLGLLLGAGRGRWRAGRGGR